MPLYKTCSGTVELSQEQANYVFHKLCDPSIEEAVYRFSMIMVEERISPDRMQKLVKRLIRREPK